MCPKQEFFPFAQIFSYTRIDLRGTPLLRKYFFCGLWLAKRPCNFFSFPITGTDKPMIQLSSFIAWILFRTLTRRIIQKGGEWWFTDWLISTFRSTTSSYRLLLDFGRWRASDSPPVLPCIWPLREDLKYLIIFGPFTNNQFLISVWVAKLLVDGGECAKMKRYSLENVVCCDQTTPFCLYVWGKMISFHSAFQVCILCKTRK